VTALGQPVDAPAGGVHAESGDATAQSSPGGSPAALLETLRSARNAQRGARNPECAETVWTAILALADAVSAQASPAGEARDVLQQAIDLAVDYCAFSPHVTFDIPNELRPSSVEQRLARHRSLDPLLADFSSMATLLKPLLARVHLGEGYKRHSPRLRSYCGAKRLRKSGVTADAVVNGAFARLFTRERLRSWDFLEDEKLYEFLSRRVDTEARNRVAQRFTRKYRFRPLEAHGSPGSNAKVPGNPAGELSQPSSQEADLLGEELGSFLNPLEREFLKKHDAGYTNEEIAREFDMHRTTVANHLGRALQTRRDLYERG